jgi:hypothetical protein
MMRTTSIFIFLATCLFLVALVDPPCLVGNMFIANSNLRTICNDSNACM